ncbi:MAG TPA: YbhB/YbcL family Raf kinase inhibitor-like protein [Ktedonobacteraceae bacterium]|nr:YbhB/YbcL family Raf kinase inhibitor-like protein [Ktedonobacteraceae bacterium]
MSKHLVGRLLRGIHAGEKDLAWNHPAVSSSPTSIVLTSPAFAPGTAIPARYAGKGVGQNISPPLAWEHVPKGAVELILVMEDPDVPFPHPFVHLIATGIPPQFPGLPEGALSGDIASLPIQFGRGSFNRMGYAGPRALPGHGPHRYLFELFALGCRLNFPAPPTRAQLLSAFHSTVIGRGQLEGIFEQL